MVIGKAGKLTTMMYKVLMNLYNAGSFLSPWLLFVRDTLNHCGLRYVWQRQECLGYYKTGMSNVEKGYITNVN